MIGPQRSRTLAGLGLALAFALTFPVTAVRAQDRSRGENDQTSRAQGRPRDRDQADRDGGQAQGRRTVQDRAADVRVVPEGWVRIGADYDGDGEFDAIETIYVFDLQEARNRSASRRAGGGGQGGGSSLGDVLGARMSKVTGTITELKSLKLSGIDQEHQLARIETEQGRTAKVDLGPKSELEALGLKAGDEISVTGQRGTINDRGLLFAHKIEAGEETVEVTWPHDNDFLRVRGEILSTRTTNFQNRGGEHLVARVKLKSGRTAQVILGPKEKLGDLDLKEGEQAAMLVHPGRLNGRSALVADVIRLGDKMVELRSQHGDRRFGSGDRGGQGSPTTTVRDRQSSDDRNGPDRRNPNFRRPSRDQEDDQRRDRPRNFRRPSRAQSEDAPDAPKTDKPKGD